MSQQFILIPKENYINKQAKSLDILEDETVNEKAKLLTLLQSVEIVVDDETVATREIETDTSKNLR